MAWNDYIEAAISTAVNVGIFVVFPFLLYALYHQSRHKRGVFGKDGSLRRAGVQIGEPKYLGYAAVAAALLVGGICAWAYLAPGTIADKFEPLTREESAMASFAGMGLGVKAIVLALLYGAVQTGFAEEFIFRGLIAGSLGRRLPLWAANLIQATIFLAPHFLVLLIEPGMWPILVLIFVAGLFKGWLRIKSGSILGPWLLHASANVTVCLMIAAYAAAPAT